MIQKIVLLTLCTSMTLTSNEIQRANTIQQNESNNSCTCTKSGRWHLLAKKIAKSALLGSIVGSAYGASCAYLENKSRWIYSLWPISWIIFLVMKHATLESILRDAKKYKVDCNRTTLYNSAWIADWLAYIYVNEGPFPPNTFFNQ